MYSLEIESDVIKALRKLEKKDRKQLDDINKKIEQILENSQQFKPLKSPLEGLRRVHVGSFVMIYEIIEKSMTVRILKYKHHDEAYR